MFCVLCRAGLRARLLVPVGLGACVWACNQSGLHTVTRTEEGCLILGFLSFKVLLARRCEMYIVQKLP